MDLQQLDVLEDKIKKLITALKALRGENEALTRKIEDQDKTIRQLKHDLDRRSKSAEESESLQQQVDTLNKERDQVRNRLETLVSQLEDREARL